MRKIVPALLIASLGIAGAALAGSHLVHRAPHAAGPGMHVKLELVEHLTEKLGLTQEQQEAARQLHEETMARAQPLMDQHHQQMEEIHARLDAGNADPADIGARMIQAHESLKQLRAAHKQAMERFSTLLTEEQRAKLEELEAEHPHRMRIHKRF